MKTFLKINDNQYPATFLGRTVDREWGDRDSIAITLNMTYAQAAEIFTDGLEWSLVQQFDAYTDADGNPVAQEPVDTDYSDYCKAGPITDNRNGTVTAKMGKITDGEALAELVEVLA